ncbi:type ISP restriction/modification enzyme [Streptomyces sp. NPDC057638]|uniref:type ISP restriction/modification enzyme n=1 Tax=Streptomyces sp. NPDC057638 TaxID=3346190 RepID=UPI0036742DF9
MPMLDELMPWGVRPLRPGRPWVMAPDAGSLTARWDTVIRAEGAAQDALFGSTRARTPRTAVTQLPGRRTGTAGLAEERGRCPDPVRILHGPYDQRWLIPDHRLLDLARPELWRVADAHQIFAVETGHPGTPGGLAVVPTALLPDGHSPAGRPGAIRPLFRRPGGREPNLTPGLLPALTQRYGTDVTALDLLAWIVAAAHPSPTGTRVPLPVGPEAWEHGVALGHRMTRVFLRGAHGRDRPRLPGGRRPYVRTAVPARPETIGYDEETETLTLGDGRISPVPGSAWAFRVSGSRVLELWFADRTAPAAPGTLEAIRPAVWPQEWTSDLLELITVLALLADLDAERAQLALAPELAALPEVPPPPRWTRRPASVLDHPEEGPGGQVALL